MELNRAVCLDYPQADVPWFHTKYCEEQATQGRFTSLNSIFCVQMHVQFHHPLLEIANFIVFIL
jgi:hypothetical protein